MYRSVGPFRGTDGENGSREVADGPKLILVVVILAGAAVPVPAWPGTVGRWTDMSSARATRGGSTMSACRSGPDRHIDTAAEERIIGAPFRSLYRSKHRGARPSSRVMGSTQLWSTRRERMTG
jgi:hypothetical protein